MGAKENTGLKALKQIVFHVIALIDLAIERGEDVTRSISFRNVFSEGMASCKELHEHKQRECRYPF